MDSLEPFPIVQVPDDAVGDLEQMGTKEKFWYEDDELGSSLFKFARRDHGEDWAEKVSEQLCRLLGLPHARYELATFQGKRGVVSPKFVVEDETLTAGNGVLQSLDRDYPADATCARVKVPQHTVDAIREALTSLSIEPPDGGDAPAGIGSAWEWFIGYLLLDALIGNSDRHHENWALIERAGGARRLAPTHDHGSSLGRNERETSIRRRLDPRDKNDTPETYATKCCSKLYADPEAPRPLSTLEAFEHAARTAPAAGAAWLDRLAAVTEEQMRGIVARVPDDHITDDGRTFVNRILAHNRFRLLSRRDSLQ